MRTLFLSAAATLALIGCQTVVPAEEQAAQCAEIKRQQEARGQEMARLTDGRFAVLGSRTGPDDVRQLVRAIESGQAEYARAGCGRPVEATPSNMGATEGGFMIEGRVR